MRDRRRGPGRHQQAHDFGVAWATIAEDDRFQQRGPAEAVDVVDRDVGLQQFADNLDVPAISRADQARSGSA